MMSIPPEDLDLYTALLDRLPLLGYHRDIIIYGNDKLKFELFKEAHHAGRKI
jgi:hypothetical protein